MMRNAFTLVLLTVVVAGVFGGCVVAGGSDYEHHTFPTLGSELMDLQAAHEKGTISEAEWTKMRSELIAARRWAKKDGE